MSRRAAGAWLVLALGALPAAPAGAESLQDAFRLALARDAGLGALHSDVDAAQAERTAAGRARLPSVAASASYTQFREPPALDVAMPGGALRAPIWRHDGYTASGIDASLPVWTSGRLAGAVGAADAGLAAARATAEQGAAELKLAVAEAYVGVFRARRRAEAAASGVRSLEAHAADIAVMYEKDAVPKSDLLAAEVALANVEQERLRAEHGLRLALAAYNRLVGEPLERAAELDEPAAAPSVAAGATLEALTAGALERRPEFAILKAERERYEQEARAERASALPQIGLRAGVNHLENEILDRQNFTSVGVAVEWRLFDGGQVFARTAALHGRARAATQRLEALRSQVALEVEAAVLARDDAAARVRAAGHAVEQAEENLRSARELYGSGLATNTQVLDAERLRLVALADRDDARFDLLLAGFRIQKAAGEL